MLGKVLDNQSVASVSITVLASVKFTGLEAANNTTFVFRLVYGIEVEQGLVPETVPPSSSLYNPILAARLAMSFTGKCMLSTFKRLAVIPSKRFRLYQMHSHVRPITNRIYPGSSALGQASSGSILQGGLGK